MTEADPEPTPLGLVAVVPLSRRYLLHKGWCAGLRRLGDRRFVFRNRERLELVFDLMALDLAKAANELRYREIIRSHLLTNDGRPRRVRRALDDHGGSSIRRAVGEVETRLKRRREQNARAQRAHLERLKAAGTARVRTPSRRTPK